MTADPVATQESLQGGASRPVAPSDVVPEDIHANGHDLSVEEHYRIARMSREEVGERYLVPDVDEFVARVKVAIRFWDGVDL